MKFIFIFLASFINLVDPAKIVTLVREHEITAQQSVSLQCKADGNPQPTYTWTPCDSQQRVCHESMLNVQASNKSVYTFICKVKNYLGSDSRNTTLCKLVREKYVFLHGFPFVMIMSFYGNIVKCVTRNTSR